MIFLLLLSILPPALAETKDLTALFPALIGTMDFALHPSTSPAYSQFDVCRLTLPKGSACGGAAATPRLFQFATTYGPDDPFNLVNRCVAIRGSSRVPLSTPISFDATARTVTCDPGPDEVAVAHLLLCYGRPAGAFCSMATTCFEGTNMNGKCTRDYPADEVAVALGKDGP